MEPERALTYTCRRSTCERYDIRLTNDIGWAIFTIDERGGLFTCHSDYGEFNHCWPHHGRPTFKSFLVEIARDPHYLLSKVSRRDWYDEERTQRSYRQEIIRRRHEGDCTKHQARNVWEMVTNYAGSSHELLQALDNKDGWEVLGHNLWEFIVSDYQPSHRYFAERIYPLFAAELQKELEAAHENN